MNEELRENKISITYNNKTGWTDLGAFKVYDYNPGMTTQELQYNGGIAFLQEPVNNNALGRTLKFTIPLSGTINPTVNKIDLIQGSLRCLYTEYRDNEIVDHIDSISLNNANIVTIENSPFGLQFKVENTIIPTDMSILNYSVCFSISNMILRFSHQNI